MARRKSGVRGVSRLRKKLRRVPVEIRKEVVAAIADAGELLRFEMLKRVPRDEGDLASVIELKFSNDKLAIDVGPGVKSKRSFRLAGWRAHFSEFGTLTASAQPFMGPAFEAAKKLAAQMINKAVDKALRRAAAG